MQPKSKEPKTPPKIEAAMFVPDPALDALCKQAVASARQCGWQVPSREEFEDKYKAEIASKRNE